MSTMPDAHAPSAAARSGVPIELRRVSKTFGEDSDQPFRALGEIGMSIAAGEFVSVVGRRVAARAR